MSGWLQRSGWSRSVLLLLILISFVSLQTASAVVQHPHSHSRNHSHCCAVCHAGHLGVVPGAAQPGLEAPAPSETRLRLHEYAATARYSANPSPSRAPPV